MSTPPDRPSTIITGTASAGIVEAGAIVTGVYVNGDSFTVYNNYSIEKPLTGTAPYKFLKSFTAEDHWIFKGRDSEAESIVLSVAQNQIVIVSGKAGVGKTSLVRAGVMPRLASTRTLFLTTYEDPLNVLRKTPQLVTQTESVTKAESNGQKIEEQATPNQAVATLNLIDFKTPEALSLQQIVARLTNASTPRLVVVLDQFELFFRQMDERKRSAFTSELASALNDKQLDLRLIIVVDDNELGPILRLQNVDWQGVTTSHIAVMNLSEEQVREATIQPCRIVKSEVSIDDRVVKPIFSDLVNLDSIDSPDQEKTKSGVYPPYLQIVCHTLYGAAKKLDDKRISPELYVEANGVDGIFANYLGDALKPFSPSETERAREILEKMAQPEIKGWVGVGELNLSWINEPNAKAVFTKLVTAMLLRSRTLNGQKQYTLPNPAVVKAIRRRWGSQAEQQYVAREDLEYAYSSWLERENSNERFPTLSTLHFLAQHAKYLPTNTAKEIFLLRSACESRGPTDVWLAKLKQNEKSLTVLQSLNESKPVSNDDINTKLLLGMTLEIELDKDKKAIGGLDALAQVAVRNRQKSIRETAAIALMAEENWDALKRLDKVLDVRDRQVSWPTLRRAQLRAAMTEADSNVAELNKGNLIDRSLTFFLMVGRNAYRDRYRIGAMTIGGTLGTGIALALFGAMRAKLFGKNAFNQSSIDFFFGCIFGLVISFAIATSKHFAEVYEGTSPSRKDTAPLFAKTWALLFGTLAFGGAHAFILQMAGEPRLEPGPRILLIMMGLFAGLGISWGLRDQALDETSRDGLKWKPLLIASASFFVIQLVLTIVYGWDVNKIQALVIVVPPLFYDASLPQLSQKLYDFSKARIPNLPIYIAFLGSAIIGLMFSAGIRYGLHKAITLISQPAHPISQQDVKTS